MPAPVGFPIGYPPSAGIVFQYTCTIQTDANNSFTWSGQQTMANPPGVSLTNAQLTTLATQMATDIANQMINGTPNGAPSFQQQRNNKNSHG